MHFHDHGVDLPAAGALGHRQYHYGQPCNLNINTKGQVANGEGQSRSVALVLGAAASSGTPITVSVNAGGQITINRQTVGTVTVVAVTGGS